MKAALLATALLLFPSVLFAQEQSQEPAVPTQRELTGDACRGAKEAKERLDSIYNAIVKAYSYDERFLKYLEESQKAWVAYRDAEMKAIYPPEYREAYGSMHRYCECSKAEQIIGIRIQELNQWVVGTDPGDTCAGTIMRRKK